MKNRLLTILLLLIIFVIYLMTSAGNTPYDYFVRLAQAFLKGRYFLTDNPQWLNELIPLSNQRFAVVYPPGPAVLIMPFIYLFGEKFQQQFLAHALGAGFAILTAKIAWVQTKNRPLTIWALLLAAFGNIIWYLSATGSVWYLGQVTAAFFLTASIYESVNKRRAWLASFLFAFAVISRLQTILTIPLLLYLNLKELSFRKLLDFTIPASIIFAMMGWYNYLRFGSFLETGYDLIPGVLSEPWYSKGIFHYSYAVSNLKVMFKALPIFQEQFPYILPSWGGLAIWITTPAFIYLLLPNLKYRANIFAIISLLLIATVTVFHGGTGFTQFGYRYAVDFYPLIFFILINSIKNIKWHHWVLLLISIIVNLWGVVWINIFNWVRF